VPAVWEIKRKEKERGMGSFLKNEIGKIGEIK
jgi:hypothetical protein